MTAPLLRAGSPSIVERDTPWYVVAADALLAPRDAFARASTLTVLPLIASLALVQLSWTLIRYDASAAPTKLLLGFLLQLPSVCAPAVVWASVVRLVLPQIGGRANWRTLVCVYLLSALWPAAAYVAINGATFVADLPHGYTWQGASITSAVALVGDGMPRLVRAVAGEIDLTALYRDVLLALGVATTSGVRLRRAVVVILAVHAAWLLLAALWA